MVELFEKQDVSDYLLNHSKDEFIELCNSFKDRNIDELNKKLDEFKVDEPTAEQNQEDEIPERFLKMIKQKDAEDIEIKRKALTPIELKPPLIKFEYGKRGDVYYKELPLLYNNAITLIQGGKGSLKSRFVEMIISMIIACINFNGIVFDTIIDFFTLHFDSERNLNEQLPMALRNMLKANKMLESDNLEERLMNLNYKWQSIIDIPFEDRMEYLKWTIKYYQSIMNPNQKLIVVLDVGQDMIIDPLDLPESKELMRYINELINKFDASFIIVVHENPNTPNNKTIGHFGSESTRKGSIVIKVVNTRDKGAYFEYLHTRNEKEPTEHFYMEYTKELGYIKILQPEEAVTKLENVTNENLKKIFAVYKLMNNENKVPFSCKAKHFISEYSKVYGKGDKTIKSKLVEYSGQSFEGISYQYESVKGASGSNLTFNSQIIEVPVDDEIDFDENDYPF